MDSEQVQGPQRTEGTNGLGVLLRVTFFVDHVMLLFSVDPVLIFVDLHIRTVSDPILMLFDPDVGCVVKLIYHILIPRK